MSSTLRVAYLVAFVAVSGCQSGNAQGEAKISPAGAADIEQQIAQVKTFKQSRARAGARNASVV